MTGVQTCALPICKKQAVAFKKQAAGKAQTAVSNGFSSFYENAKSSSKAPKKNFAKKSLKNKTAELIKNKARNAKTSKEAKGKEDKNGKKNKIKNKRSDRIDLNSSGNVYAEFDEHDKTLSVEAKDDAYDMDIDEQAWWRMNEELQGNGHDWGESKVKHIEFQSRGIYLPSFCNNFFAYLKGRIRGCERLNTSKVTDMSHMFNDAKLADPDVSDWDVSNVRSMHEMFYGAANASPDVSGWNTSNVTDMGSMFASTDSADPYVSGWDVSNVTDMGGMFNVATAANPNVSNWNVSNVTNMDRMFNSSKISKADLSRWDCKKLTETDGMFYSCQNLEYIKTPAGLETSVLSHSDDNFKVVRLKKGLVAVVEHE